MITAMDGSARLAALGTPTDPSVQMNLDRQMVGMLLDASTDAAMGNGKRDGHASHGGKLSLSRHRPESIGRYPRKVSKSHRSGATSEPDLAFGLCDLGLGFPELGYVSISELRTFHGPLGLAVEADQGFVADRPLSNHAAVAQAAGRITV